MESYSDISKRSDPSFKKEGDLIWTKTKARLKKIKRGAGRYNWVFVPGGAGLGSEYLTPLTDILELPGTIWHFDFPGDGSNIEDGSELNIENWFNSLHQITEILENAIIVGHSTGGMLTLATPDLESKLQGLVLVSSAPNSGWQKNFTKYVEANPIEDAIELARAYEENPSDELLKDLTIVCAPYTSAEMNIGKVKSVLENLPYNSRAHLFAEANFDSSYEAKWAPQNIPCLILSGDEDRLTPLSLFSKSPFFQGRNIILHEISNSAHFPWIDNPSETIEMFNKFSHLLMTENS